MAYLQGEKHIRYELDKRLILRNQPLSDISSSILIPLPA
jgi:hypothetical protein